MKGNNKTTTKPSQHTCIKRENDRLTKRKRIYLNLFIKQAMVNIFAGTVVGTVEVH